MTCTAFSTLQHAKDIAADVFQLILLRFRHPQISVQCFRAAHRCFQPAIKIFQVHSLQRPVSRSAGSGSRQSQKSAVFHLRLLIFCKVFPFPTVCVQRQIRRPGHRFFHDFHHVRQMLILPRIDDDLIMNMKDDVVSGCF